MAAPGALFALVALSRLVLSAGLTFHQPEEPTSAVKASDSPIRMVITLIEEMKTQAEKDAAEDEAAYDKYMCWCKKNEEAKTAAIAAAEQRIEELTALLEELAARESRLKTEIAGLEQDIAEDQEALATAIAVREKEYAAFQAEEADLKETRGLLAEAVQVLSKVQNTNFIAVPEARVALMQLKNKVSRPDFQSMMKKDLFEVLGSIADALPQGAFLPKKSASLISQPDLSDPNLLPWEKTEEQKGMEAKPTGLEGAAAGAKSYNSRSGRIVGILSEMKDETSRDLADAQRNDFRAEVAFQNLRAAKLDEIAVATAQKKRKEKELADTIAQAAEAKEDKEATEEALAADQEFLANMLKDCKFEDVEYAKRKKIRAEEVVAITETLRILTADDARSLYETTVSFVQLGSRSRLQDQRAERAMQKIAAVARKHKNWALVSLAVSTELDAFTKVKQAMDKMLAELQKQQKEEYAKWETCKANIDKTEDDIKVGMETKEDLDEKHRSLVNEIETLSREITQLQQEDSEMQVALKEAGEQRKAQNGVYQTSVMDQRATTNILNKALARLKAFYMTKSMLQVGDDGDNTPGRAIAPPPPKATTKGYQKSGGAGAVVQLLMKVIENSEVEEKQLDMDEQNSQRLYAEYVQATTASIEANRQSVKEKQHRRAEANAAKADTEGDQLANEEQLARLADLLKAHHLECDYLLKYFDIRQQARAEEIDAITDAKAVLSGADFK